MSKYYIASCSFGKDSLAMLQVIKQNPQKYPLDEIVLNDNRPVSENTKIADYIYYSNEKSISYDKCISIARLLVEGGYGSIKRFAKQLLERPLDVVVELLEEAAK